MKKRYFTMCATLLCMSGLVQAEQNQDNAPIQYNNRVAILPNHPAYERIKPDAVYVGIEGYLVPLFNRGGENILLDGECRIGYNFLFNGKDHVTPFSGIGYVSDFRLNNFSFSHCEMGILYGTLGCLYNHQFSAKFSLGVNAKWIIGSSVRHAQREWNTCVNGFDAALPMTFQFGKKKNWDYRLEPFDLYLKGSKASVNYIGLRSSIGYRF